MDQRVQGPFLVVETPPPWHATILLPAFSSRLIFIQDRCQSLTRLIVTAADSCTKLLLTCTLAEEPHRQLALKIVNLVLVCIELHSRVKVMHFYCIRYQP